MRRRISARLATEKTAAIAIALVFSAINLVLILRRIAIEDRALAG